MSDHEACASFTKVYILRIAMCSEMFSAITWARALLKRTREMEALMIFMSQSSLVRSNMQRIVFCKCRAPHCESRKYIPAGANDNIMGFTEDVCLICAGCVIRLDTDKCACGRPVLRAADSASKAPKGGSFCCSLCPHRTKAGKVPAVSQVHEESCNWRTAYFGLNGGTIGAKADDHDGATVDISDANHYLVQLVMSHIREHVSRSVLSEPTPFEEARDVDMAADSASSGTLVSPPADQGAGGLHDDVAMIPAQPAASSTDDEEFREILMSTWGQSVEDADHQQKLKEAERDWLKALAGDPQDESAFDIAKAGTDTSATAIGLVERVQLKARRDLFLETMGRLGPAPDCMGDSDQPCLRPGGCFCQKHTTILMSLIGDCQVAVRSGDGQESQIEGISEAGGATVSECRWSSEDDPDIIRVIWRASAPASMVDSQSADGVESAAPSIATRTTTFNKRNALVDLANSSDAEFNAFVAYAQEDESSVVSDFLTAYRVKHLKERAKLNPAANIGDEAMAAYHEAIMSDMHIVDYLRYCLTEAQGKDRMDVGEVFHFVKHQTWHLLPNQTLSASYGECPAVLLETVKIALLGLYHDCRALMRAKEQPLDVDDFYVLDRIFKGAGAFDEDMRNLGLGNDPERYQQYREEHRQSFADLEGKISRMSERRARLLRMRQSIDPNDETVKGIRDVTISRMLYVLDTDSADLSVSAQAESGVDAVQGHAMSIVESVDPSTTIDEPTEEQILEIVRTKVMTGNTMSFHQQQALGVYTMQHAGFQSNRATRSLPFGSERIPKEGNISKQAVEMGLRVMNSREILNDNVPEHSRWLILSYASHRYHDASFFNGLPTKDDAFWQTMPRDFLGPRREVWDSHKLAGQLDLDIPFMKIVVRNVSRERTVEETYPIGHTLSVSRPSTASRYNPDDNQILENVETYKAVCEGSNQFRIDVDGGFAKPKRQVPSGSAGSVAPPGPRPALPRALLSRHSMKSWWSWR